MCQNFSIHDVHVQMQKSIYLLSGDFPDNFCKPCSYFLIWIFTSLILTIFVIILDFFYLYLLQKKLMTSSSTRSYQQFFDFELFKFACLRILLSNINIGLILLPI